MTIDSFLHFILKHNSIIIEILFALILLLVLFLAFKIFIASQKTAQADATLSDGSQLSHIENALKKIMEQSAHREDSPEGASSAGANEKIEKLKLELQVKEAEIQNLKSASGNTMSPADKAKLDARVKDLENRLAEYEIIAEDIADLSRYKEENNKLKKENETLRSNGGVLPPAEKSEAVAEAAPVAAVESPAEPTGEVSAAAPVEAPPEASSTEVATAAEPSPAIEAVAAESSAEASAPTNPKLELVKDNPETSEPTPVAEGGEVPVAAAPAAGGEGGAFGVDDDIMAEFAKAVEEQKEKTSHLKLVPNESTEGAAKASEIEAKEDIKNDATLSDPSLDPIEMENGDLDIDKMLSEADELPKEEDLGVVESSLEANLDEDKLLAEANSMKEETPSQEKKEEPVNEDVALMNEFDKFSKS